MLGEFGWITRPGGVVRITKYTADRQGYRVKHITRDLAIEKKEKGEEVNTKIWQIFIFL